MKTKIKKPEIAFDPAALVARVEGFAAGHTPARERERGRSAGGSAKIDRAEKAPHLALPR